MAYKEIENEEMKFVNELISSKDNITARSRTSTSHSR